MTIRLRPARRNWRERKHRSILAACMDTVKTTLHISTSCALGGKWIRRIVNILVTCIKKILTMKNKYCARCNQTKPLSEFNKTRSDCRDCQARDSVARRNATKTFLRKVKALASCIHCGLKDYRLIDFHHLSPNNKRFSLSQASNNRISLKM